VRSGAFSCSTSGGQSRVIAEMNHVRTVSLESSATLIDQGRPSEQPSRWSDRAAAAATRATPRRVRFTGVGFSKASVRKFNEHGAGMPSFLH
jgi:hypothetical protein